MNVLKRVIHGKIPYMYGEPIHYILIVLLVYAAGVYIYITFVEKNCLRAVSFFNFSSGVYIYIYISAEKNIGLVRSSHKDFIVKL